MPMNRIFPQLSSGALTQYPLRIREEIRTVINQTADGRRRRYSDPGASTQTWEVSLSRLSDAEWAAIENLFRECEGRRHSFLFLDPWANLITASESYSNSVWAKDPGIGLSEGLIDPEGGTRATQITNVSGTLQTLRQSIAIPASFQYSFSVYARSTAPTQLRLIVSTDGNFAERLFELSTDWQRYSLFSAMSATTESVEIAIQLSMGTTIELFGAQMEAQPAPSPYQRTALRTGRYPEARFAADTLTQVSTDPGEHSTTIRIVSHV